MMDERPNCEEVILNGSLVVIPNHEAWQEIAREPIFLGTAVYFSRSVTRLINFTKENEGEFRLGITPPQKGQNKWMPLSLLSMEYGWQRVFVERVTCGQCMNAVIIANPLLSELYFFCDNRWEAMGEAMKCETGCPSCGSKLPRPAIWAKLEQQTPASDQPA